MSSGDMKLKCQFCSLMDFNSAYKIIPHIYFGHRKKICRQVRDHGAVQLRCPAPGCEFQHSAAVAGEDTGLIYAELARMFVVLEEHILAQHTQEDKLVQCPYCQTDLSQLIYWVHLEEHMGSPATPSPTKPAGAASNIVKTPETPKKDTGTANPLLGSSPSTQPATPDSSQPQATKSAEGGNDDASDVNKESITPQTPAQSAELQSADTAAQDDSTPIKRVTRNSKQKQSQDEIKEKLLEIERKIKQKEKEEKIRKQREEEQRLQHLEEEKQKQQEEEMKQKAEEELRLKKEQEEQRLKEEEELRKEIEKKMAEDEAKKKKAEELRRQQQLELKKKREEELKRQKEEKALEKQRQKELERKRKDEQERIRMEEELRRQKEEDLKRQVEEQMKLLKEEEERKHSKNKDTAKSKDNALGREENMHERPKSDDKLDTHVSGTTPGSRTRSREVSGDFDRDVRRRSISGDKKTSSVWNKGKEPDKERQEEEIVSPDQKPVLTEEMERSIIYGNFKKKESREDKLVAVKREIESRFKAEEERRAKIMEEKRKAEAKEREKIRLAEEKLRREREKLKEEKRKTKQLLEELKNKEKEDEREQEEEPMEEENEEEEEGEGEEDNDEELSEPTGGTKRKREDSPDQYEKIKMEIRKIDLEIEKKEKARRVEKKVEESRSSSISPEPVAELPASNDLPQMSHEAPVVSNTRPVVAYPVEDDEDDEELDDLEIMMREFQERESKKSGAGTGQSIVDETNKSPSPKAKSPLGSPTIPFGFDKDGHPLSSAVPGTSLRWDEDGAEGPTFQSAYQLLAHVFLNHRKKIVTRSRKARTMRLEWGGFSTASSATGVSIDFFTRLLPEHLGQLCDHIRENITGEDDININISNKEAANNFSPGLYDAFQKHLKSPDEEDDRVQYQAWFWQHLANHQDARRMHCAICNNFPFRDEACLVCAGAGDRGGRSLEELARAVESGAVRAEDLAPRRHADQETAETGGPLRTEPRPLISSDKIAEREKEERQIVIPRLPKQFPQSGVEIRTPAMWKYHVMAHKYGEVYSARSGQVLLAHKFPGHQLSCAGELVKVVRYRGDTWLEVEEAKVKVFYEYEGADRDTRVTVARCSYNGVTMSGAGVNHEQAVRTLQREVAAYVMKMKESDTSADKENEEDEDRQALIDLFVELARVDQVNSLKTYSLKINEQVVPVETDTEFTKYGKAYSVASVKFGNVTHRESGLSSLDAVNNLAAKINRERIVLV